MNKIRIFTDGAASMNLVNGEYQRGNGGSAMAIINDKEEIEYSLLFIDVDKLPKDMHFFYDPNMEKAVYTEQVIPHEAITKNFKINF